VIHKPPVFVIAPPRAGGGVVAAALVDHFGCELNSQSPEQSGGGLHWSPELGLRVRELATEQSNSHFIIVLREPAPTIASLMLAWTSQGFGIDRKLPGWWGDPWAFGVIPAWEELIGKPVVEVCAGQWSGYLTMIFDDLDGIDSDRWIVTSYERLTAQPQVELDRLGAWLESERVTSQSDLRLSPGTLTPPKAGKWRRQAGEIAPALEKHSAVVARLAEFRDRYAPLPLAVDVEAVDVAPVARKVTRPSAGTVFSSQHTNTFPELLAKMGASMIVSTYKSGHVITLRADSAGKLNTEFMSHRRPMGIARAGSRLAIGTETSVINFSNTSSMSNQLEPANVNDAVFTTRSVINTGDIAIHEMAYAGEELWLVNTRFSCLCTLDMNYSFEPRWRPSWITSLAAEDRCHLNGLAIRDGRPRYVTALAQTDNPQGWRDMKGVGGVIVDIDSDEVLASGLSMPHSPRWHENAIWFLESGRGSLSRLDMTTGAIDTKATVPGFSRGLAFIGPYALIGLSQVRESVFSDLPVTQSKDERNCGIWMVDTRSGQTVGFVKFEGIVQEIFDLQVLPDTRWPTFINEPSLLTASSFVLSQVGLAQIAGDRTIRE